jgi:L-fuconolactonase
MMRLDSHQHFWRFSEEEYGWMNSQMQEIKKDHLPKDLLPELQKVGFDGCIAIQARQLLQETDWLLHLADHNDFIKGVVGWIDLCSSQVEKQLDQYSKHPKLVGLRHVIHDEPDHDFILRPDFLRGISLLNAHHLTFDLLIFPSHLPNAITLVKQFPELTFILDHIAKPKVKDSILFPWKEDIERLASYPNVYCKVSGMVTEAQWHQWKMSDFTPYLDVVFCAFGCERVMIGSDWPVCKVAGSYQQVMNIVFSYIGQYTDTEKEQILGGNAIRAYSVK